MLDSGTQLRLDHLPGVRPACQSQIAHLFHVGVGDPLGDVGHPALRALALQPAHKVLVAEVVEAAENLTHDADQRPTAVEARGYSVKASPRPQQRRGQRCLLTRSVGATLFQRLTEVLEGLAKGSVGFSRLRFVRPRLQQKFAQNVSRDHGPPCRPHESGVEILEVAVAVFSVRREDLYVAVALFAQDLSQKRRILTEAARPVGSCHHEDCVLRIEARLLSDLEEIPGRNLGGKAFVAARVLAAQLERMCSRGWRGTRLNTHPAQYGTQRRDASLGHGGNVDRFSGQRMVGANLPGYAAMFAELHRKNPLLSR